MSIANFGFNFESLDLTDMSFPSSPWSNLLTLSYLLPSSPFTSPSPKWKSFRKWLAVPLLHPSQTLDT